MHCIPLVWLGRVLFFVTLILHACTLHAQPTLDMDQYTSEEGLSENVVYCIHQDKQGFMWFGTDYGLNRYDGYSFRHYHSDNTDSTTLSGEAILCIYEEPSGGMWIGTYSGLNYFDPKTGRAERIQVDDHGTVFAVSDIHDLGNGNLLVRSTEIRAFLFNIKSRLFQPLNNPLRKKGRGYRIHQLPNERFGILCESADGISEIGIYLRSAKSLDFHTMQEIFHFIPQGNLNYYYQDSHGYQYLCFQDQPRIIVYNASGEQKAILDFSARQTGFPLHTYAVTEIDSQQVWIGTNRGLAIFDHRTQSFTIPEIDVSASGVQGVREIRDIACDNSGNIWMGTFGDGLLKSTRQVVPFTHVTTPQITWQQTAPMIVGLMPWPGEALVVETNDGNVSIIRNDRPITSRPKKNIGLDTLVAMSLGGRIPVYSPFQKQFLQNLPVIKDHERWLYRFILPNDTTVIYYYYGFFINTPHVQRTFGNQWVKNVTEDDSRYWFATADGLWSIDKWTFKDTVYRHVAGDTYSLSESNLYDVYADQKGKIWIGTKGGGLNYFDIRTQRFYYYTMEEGLPDNVVYVVLPDQMGHLWLTTNKGISRFNPTDQTFQNFSVRDGLLNSEFNTRGGIVMTDGTMCLAGTRGIDFFKPGEISTSRPLYGVFISEWRVNNLDVQPSERTSLGYNENNITASFTANEFVRPDQVYFRYRLNPDLPWMRLQGTNTVNFTALQPGSYHFEVQASNDNLNWTASTGREFIIRPPWWNTWWFATLCLLLATGLLYLFYRARINQLKRVQLMRTKISRDLHDEVGSALSSIHLFSSVASRSLATNTDKAKDALEHINNNSRRVLENMSDIVWAINTGGGDKTSLERKLKNYSYELLTPLGINCVYDIDADAEKKLQHIEARKNILLIAKEAMNNIAKYSAATEAKVSLKVEEGFLHLVVSDNGKGIDPEQVRNGNGILNMQKRTEEMGGIFSLGPETIAGTTVQCRVPIANISDAMTHFHV